MHLYTTYILATTINEQDDHTADATKGKVQKVILANYVNICFGDMTSIHYICAL